MTSVKRSPARFFFKGRCMTGKGPESGGKLVWKKATKGWVSVLVCLISMLKWFQNILRAKKHICYLRGMTLFKAQNPLCCCVPPACWALVGLVGHDSWGVWPELRPGCWSRWGFFSLQLSPESFTSRWKVANWRPKTVVFCTRNRENQLSQRIDLDSCVFKGCTHTGSSSLVFTKLFRVDANGSSHLCSYVFFSRHHFNILSSPDSSPLIITYHNHNMYI